MKLSNRHKNRGRRTAAPTVIILIILSMFLILGGCTQKDKDGGTSVSPSPSESETSPSESPSVSPSPSETPSPSGSASSDTSETPTATPSVSPTPSETLPPSPPTPSETPPVSPPPDAPSTPGDPVAPSKDTQVLLTTILNNAMDKLSEDDSLPMSFEDIISADNVQDRIGLTAGELSEYVVEAYSSTAAIGTTAHLISLVHCKDAEAAKTVKDLIAKGFNSGRLICAFPDCSVVVESGEFVLLVSTRTSIADALIEGFGDTGIGALGTPDVFYTKP